MNAGVGELEKGVQALAGTAADHSINLHQSTCSRLAVAVAVEAAWNYTVHRDTRGGRMSFAG